MNKLSLIFIILCTIFLSDSVSAQGKPSKRDRQSWNQEMQAVKNDFIARKLDLTAEQREKFLPLYSKMEEETRKVNDDTRRMQKEVLNKGQASTDLEYEKCAEALFELRGRENTIEMKYFQQFKTILSPKQLFMLKDAEQEFTKELMKQHRKVLKH